MGLPEKLNSKKLEEIKKEWNKLPIVDPEHVFPRDPEYKLPKDFRIDTPKLDKKGIIPRNMDFCPCDDFCLYCNINVYVPHELN